MSPGTPAASASPTAGTGAGNGIEDTTSLASNYLVLRPVRVRVTA